MANLLNIRSYFLIFLLFGEISLSAFQITNKENLEKTIEKAIAREINCKEIKVKTILDSNNPSKINNLAIRMDGVNIGGIIADYITIQYNYPILDNKNLKNKAKLKFLSYSDQKVAILLSINSLQNYLSLKEKEFGKNNVNIRLKFSPPFIECFYDVPQKEIASETAQIISKFIPGDKLEGYAAFTLQSKKSELSAYSSKVILNHFLIPGSILSIFEKKFNPFEKISAINIFNFEINNIVVQSKYVLLTN
ncbi:MAG: hypothetical protein NTZ27_11960 [Ignavibacteriales bacterium]|nr:hypothetical protein [Ignavibacteriales bacterium]